MLTIQSPPQDVVIPSTGGVALRGRHWTRGDPRATIVAAHGFGEHGGRYRHVAEALGLALEVDFLTFDFRGHGRSPGRRGVLRAYEELVCDLRAMLDWVDRERPGLPVFVLGHSNGGLVALRLALEGGATYAGLILSNPALKVAARVPRHKLQIGRFLRRHAPGVTLTAKLGEDQMTRDLEMQRQRRADTLCHNRISPPFYFGMTESGVLVMNCANQIHDPVLLLLGGSDPVIDAAATRAAFDRFRSADKTLRVYPGMLHEPLNEIGRQQVFADVTDWLRPRLDRAR